MVPVDVYAPGCPPNPQTLLHSILTLHEQVRTGEITQRRAGGAGAGIHVDEQRGGDQRITVVRPPVHVGTPR